MSGKSSEIKDSKVFKFLRNKYMLVTVFFIVWIFFFDTNNLIRWYSTIEDVAVQQRQKEYYKAAIRKADEQLKELQSNRDSLEKFAREQYFFHESDEEVFIVKENSF